MFKTEKIQSIYVQDEEKSLISFNDVIAESRVVSLGKPAQKVDSKSTLNKELCPLPDSFEKVFEELNTKTEEDAICCKIEVINFLKIHFYKLYP